MTIWLGFDEFKDDPTYTTQDKIDTIMLIVLTTKRGKAFGRNNQER